MNAVVYCRVSSKEQIEGTSLVSQQHACREYAGARGITILKTFIEQGESAKFADRTQLLELLDYCRTNRGTVQVLLVWKVDRFARNVADHFSVKGTLLKYGVRIVSVTEPIDTNPEGKLMETILAGFAQFDNDIRAMRTVQGMRRKIHEGIFPFRPPLGYRSASDRGEKKNDPDVPRQPLFGLLQKAWRTYATGGYTKAQILNALKTWGVESRHGVLTPQGLDAMFQNRYYAGILVDPWSGAEFQGRHQPMVTQREFAMVQQAVARRTRSQPHIKDRPEFPLRGLVRCNGCSLPMTGAFSRGRSRRYAYYVCHHRQCPAFGKSHGAQSVLDEFRSFLHEIAPNAEYFERVEALTLRLGAERNCEAVHRKARSDAQRQKFKVQTQRLIRMAGQGLITNEEFTVERNRIARLQYALEANAIQGPLDINQLKSYLAEISKPLAQLAQTWESLPARSRRRFEQILLPVGFVHQKSRTAELGCLFRLRDTPANALPAEVDLSYKMSNSTLR